jgi:hypothetical protein
MPIKWNAARHTAKSIFDTIGRTPLVQLNAIPREDDCEGDQEGEAEKGDDDP